MNLQEDYCSYEISILLKEKGFDEYCRSFYELGEPRVYVGSNGVCNNTMFQEESNECIARPTHQMAMKWLREAHGIIITISPTLNIYGHFTGYLISFDRLSERCLDYLDEFGIDSLTYEEAVEAALKYSLENLI